VKSEAQLEKYVKTIACYQTMVENLQDAHVDDSENEVLKFNRNKLAEEQSKHTELATIITNLKMEKSRREAEIQQEARREADRKIQEEKDRLESERKLPLSQMHFEKKFIEFEGNFELFRKSTDLKITYLLMLIQKLCDGTYLLLLKFTCCLNHLPFCFRRSTN
jgi:hypothetical protein